MAAFQNPDTFLIKVDPKEAWQYIKNLDWSASDALTDEDIARQVAEDPDAAPLPPETDVPPVIKPRVRRAG